MERKNGEKRMESKKRGRPVKEKCEKKEEKKRGRPRKSKEVVSNNVGEELIASLLLSVLGVPLGVPPPYDGMGMGVGVGVPLGVPPPYDGMGMGVGVGVPLGVPPPYDGMGMGVGVGVPPPCDGISREDPSSSERNNVCSSERNNVCSSEAEDEEETCVIKFEIEGKIYLKSGDDVLYDINTHDALGIWNEKCKKIDEVPDEEDEEELRMWLVPQVVPQAK